MSASARFVVHSTATGEIFRLGRCPVGQEIIQANSGYENYLDESQVSTATAALATDTLSDALHFIDVDDSNIVKNRVQIAPIWTRTYAIANGTDTITATNLPSPSTDPLFALTTVHVVGPGVDTTVTTATGSASFTFSATGAYTITFSAYPKYLEATQAVTVSNSLITPSVTATAYLGAITTTFSGSTTLTGLVATSALGVVDKAITHEVAGVAATGNLGTINTTITVMSESLVTTAALGSATPSIDHNVSGVEATSALGNPVAVDDSSS